MSKVLTAVGLLVIGAFPLMAAPQAVVDGPGVTVGMNGATVMHRMPVGYPPAAIQQGVQGTLSVEVKLDATGNVADARVLSGPEELRKSTLQSVLQWHFTRDAAGSTRTINITFQVPKENPVSGVIGSSSVTVMAPREAISVRGGVLGGIVAPVGGLRSAQVPTRTIKSITVLGLPEQAARELLGQLPVHEGDTWSPELSQKLNQVVREFDEHLSVRMSPAGNSGEMALQIVPPGASAPVLSYSPAPVPGAVNVNGNVQAAMVLKKVAPIYPQLAMNAQVSGVVSLAAIIGKDGTVQELHSLGGPALLIQAAMDAVKQWVYKPTLLNEQPVAVQTTIEVNFTLNQ
jgi:TonB family protein